MAKENYLRIPELDGTISDPRYKKWIPLLGFSLNSGTNTGLGGPNTGMGRAIFDNMTVIKKVDVASADLMGWNTKGKQLAEVALFFGGLEPGSAIAILLIKKVYIDTVQWGGSSGGDEQPNEIVVLSFSESQYMPVVQYLARRTAAAIAGLFH